MSKYHVISSGMVTRLPLPSITRQRGTTTGEANLMLYGAGKTTVSNNTTFVDSSTNAFTVTRNGDTVQSGFNPFSGVSNGAGFFDGTGDSLSVADNAALELGSNEFCIEGWCYPTSSTGFGVLITKRTNSTTSSDWIIYRNSGSYGLVFSASANGSTWNIIDNVSFGTMTPNAWNHFAVYRVANAWYGALNGTVTTLNASNSSAVTNSATPVTIGSDTNANPFAGYLSNVRIVNGSPVYTSANFTPPTSALTAITNTSLLLLMENYSIVNSTSTNLPITISGGATISTTQAPTGMSSSMYFNSATSSFVQTPTNTTLNVSSGNYTVEGWVYLDMATYSQFDLGGRGIASDYLTNLSGRWLISVNTAGRLEFVEQDAVGANSVTVTDSSAIALQQWVYFAAVKSGTTMYLFKNGVSVGTATSAVRTTFPGRINVGQYTVDTNYRGFFLGYISNIRLSKGTAVYTSNFTTPSAPLPLGISVPNFVTNNIYGVNQIP
jgi:hypothetical protein